MNSKNEGNMLFDALKTLLATIMHICGLVIAWVLKGAGQVILFLSMQLFKLSGK